jgi:hypothetical protein
MDENAMSDNQERLNTLKARLAAVDVEKDGADKVLLAILRDACMLVHDAEASHAPKETLDALTTQVSKFLDDAVDLAYSADYLFDFLPSFAHSDEHPEIEDKLENARGGLCERRRMSETKASNNLRFSIR